MLFWWIFDGGEGSAQVDRLFFILYVTWYADLAVYYEYRAPCGHCRCTSFDRLSVILLLSARRQWQKLKKEAENLSFFFYASFDVWHFAFRKMNYARSTFPDFRHLAQTYCVLVPPFTLQRTDLMFDLNILFDLLWEWLTLFPKWAPFPHTAHFAMACTSLSGYQK